MKRVEIEALLRWTYRDELPKAGAAMRLRDRVPGFGFAWSGIEAYGEHMAVIDEPNDWGLAPDLGAVREPHPVAVLVGRHVDALAAWPVVLPRGWDPLVEMGDLGALGQAAVAAAVERLAVVDAAGERHLRASAAWLVRRYALLGGAPVWEAEPAQVRVESANGRPRWFRTIQIADGLGGMRPVEVDGYDPKRKRPWPGAYRRLYLDPCPIDAAVARAEYEVWHAALAVLVEDLNIAVGCDVEAGRIALGDAIEVLPSPREAEPWLSTGAARRQRVLEVACAPVVTWPLALWGGAGLKQLRPVAAAPR